MCNDRVCGSAPGVWWWVHTLRQSAAQQSGSRAGWEWTRVSRQARARPPPPLLYLPLQSFRGQCTQPRFHLFGQLYPGIYGEDVLHFCLHLFTSQVPSCPGSDQDLFTSSPSKLLLSRLQMTDPGPVQYSGVFPVSRLLMFQQHVTQLTTSSLDHILPFCICLHLKPASLWLCWLSLTSTC